VSTGTIDAARNLPGDRLETAEEAALLERARAGDRDAFARIMEAHLDPIWRLVWRIARHQEDAEDIVQEVFLAAWQALPGFRGEARVSTWLHRIAVTRALNHRARLSEKVRRASVPIDEPLEEAGLADLRPGASPLRAFEAREIRRRLADCLEKLPAAWRAALALREGGGRSYEEIASMLGLALGTVRSRLSRARLSLRDCVAGES
jgi:RNA polymerase sigma-70 factor (ECF subfamily)